MLARPLLALALVSSALAVPALAGEVWVVAPSGGDFAQIQPAVDAAADGDLVLVRAGNYDQFAVFDKAMTVVAEAPDVVQISGQVRVQDLAAGRVVSLVDLNVDANGERALYLVNDAGSVRVRGGVYQGTDFQNWLEFDSNHAIHVVNCSDVSLRSVEAHGGQGIGAILSPISGPGGGGDGVSSVDSKLAVHHCTLTGGDGGSDQVGEGYGGGWGGDGLRVRTGFAYVANSTLSGGHGGHGGEEDGIPPFWNRAGDGGKGGNGVGVVSITFPSDVASHAELLAIDATGGFGGSGGWGYFGSDGLPGTPGTSVGLSGNTATSNDLGGVVRRLIVEPLVSAGASHQVRVLGQPGETAFLFFNKRTKFGFSANNLGVWLIGGLPIGVQVGQLDATGSLILNTTAPNLAPSADGTTMHFQALLGGVSGGRFLTGSNVTAVLQPGF